MLKNKFGAENKCCPEFDYTSFWVLQIFKSKIFLLKQFKYFESIFLNPIPDGGGGLITPAVWKTCSRIVKGER